MLVHSSLAVGTAKLDDVLLPPWIPLAPPTGDDPLLPH